MSMQSYSLLSRRPHRPAPAVPLGTGATLALARLHEGCGTARHSFAMLVAARLQALQRTGSGGMTAALHTPVWWITSTWQTEQMNDGGMAAFLSPGLSPGRLVFVRAQRLDDALWTLEEILRSGTASLAVADIASLPSLTAVRRLHLAAETGAAHGIAPLGLILTPGLGGAQGVESRWRCEPDHAAPHPGWQLDRLRARMDPPRSWRVTQSGDIAGATFALSPVPVRDAPVPA